MPTVEEFKAKATEVLEKRAALYETQKAIDADSSLSDGEKRKRIEKSNAEMDALESQARAYVVQAELRYAADLDARAYALVGVGPGKSARVSAMLDTPLTRGQSFADLAGKPASDADFGDYLRAVIYGDESRAMTKGTPANGGYLVPVEYSASVLDLARNQTRVIQAGAQVIPLSAGEVRVAKLTKDPSPQWRNESEAISQDDMNLGEVVFKPQSMAVLVKASWELVADAPNLGGVLRAALAKAFAVKLDAASLYGSGTVPTPRGVKNFAGVPTVPVATNGGPVTWDPLMAGVQAVRTANFDPSGIIHAERTEAALSGLKDNTGQYLAPPSYVANVPRYPTGQVPTNLTVGTGTNCSDSFLGDWSTLAIGVRTQFELKVLRERYADTGEIGFVGWLRADIQVTRPEAFYIVSGIK